MAQPQPNRSPAETLRNVGLWLFMIAIGLSLIILGFQGRVGSGLAAFFAPSTLAPMNEDGTAQNPGTGNVNIASGAAAVLGPAAAAFQKQQINGGVSALIDAIHGLQSLPGQLAAGIVAFEQNPTAVAQASQSGFWQGLLRGLGF